MRRGGRAKHFGQRNSFMRLDPDAPKPTRKGQRPAPRLLRGYSGEEDLPSMTRFLELAVAADPESEVREVAEGFVRAELPKLTAKQKPSKPKKEKKAKSAASANDNAERQAKRAKKPREKKEKEAKLKAELEEAAKLKGRLIARRWNASAESRWRRRRRRQRILWRRATVRMTRRRRRRKRPSTLQEENDDGSDVLDIDAKGRALEVLASCREPELARDTVRVSVSKLTSHVAVGACVTYTVCCPTVSPQTFFFNPLLVIDRTAFYEDRRTMWTPDVPTVGLRDVEQIFGLLLDVPHLWLLFMTGSPRNIFFRQILPAWVGSALSVCVCLSILRACVRSQDLELGRQPRLRVLRHLSTMMHGKATSEISRDESICRECGGWLGRKPGMKPWCSLAGCPGRTAPKDDSTSVPAKPSAPPQPRPPPTPPHRSEAVTRTAPPGTKADEQGQ